jgi:HSP90 family molecular chaperone
MPVEERTFQIHLEGLIRLLAQNLYADPDIFLREMIQNAHDSIGRRAVLAAERGEAELPPPQIRVMVDGEAETIEISGNGCGLTRNEIDELLHTAQGDTAGPDPYAQVARQTGANRYMAQAAQASLKEAE